jgi:hypothetical protein
MKSDSLGIVDDDDVSSNMNTKLKNDKPNSRKSKKFSTSSNISNNIQSIEDEVNSDSNRKAQDNR